MAKKDLYVELCKSSELLLPRQDRAITQDGGDPQINLNICFGCGQCIPTCPSGALSMVVRTKTPASQIVPSN